MLSEEDINYLNSLSCKISLEVIPLNKHTATEKLMKIAWEAMREHLDLIDIALDTDESLTIEIGMRREHV